MYQGTASVDILSLEDFHTRLSTHLAEAQRILRNLNAELGRDQPKLGTFHDGATTTSAYRSVHTQEVVRAERLVAAIQATKDATAAILANYQTTEARNGASADDIARHLRGVSEALRERDVDTADRTVGGNRYV